MRLINILVIAVLILSASFVYKIKFDSTLQAERIGKIRNELRRERDATARLRAEWARLDTPDRIQGLAERHLKLKAIDATQFTAAARTPQLFRRGACRGAKQGNSSVRAYAAWASPPAA